MASRHDGDSGHGNAVERWFGDGFDLLHPLLQSLHRGSGRLEGSVALRFGRGLAGMWGRRLARKVGIPDIAGPHHLEVDIRHDETTLYWNRRFDRASEVLSVFTPVGTWPDGHWIERTGPVEMKLAVDVDDGSWRWRPIGLRVRGLTVPLWLVPRTTAGKLADDGKYRFHVGFSFPIAGEILSYSGLLEAVGRSQPADSREDDFLSVRGTRDCRK